MIKTEKEILDLGYIIENDLIKSIDVSISAHVGNIVSLEVLCSEELYPISSYNNTRNLGLLIQTLAKFFGLAKEDTINLSQIKDIPCRLVFDGWQCVGIGHFMRDEFILTTDLLEECV